MPKQGQSVESCIVSEFKKKVGDTVKVGDVLFGYETDKATFEEESKFEGVVLASPGTGTGLFGSVNLGGGVYAFVPYLGLSLTYDHRAIDGGEATRFLKQVAQEIENLEVEF